MTVPEQRARLTAARYGVPALLAAAVCVCFLPVLHCGFVSLDDRYNFGGHANFRGLSPQHLAWMFSTVLNGHYQPLSWVTHGAVYLVWGMDPFGYHLVNLLLHVANAVVLYFLTRRFLELGWPGAIPSKALALPVAAATGALFWAVHPLRVEAVAWVTERREVLSTFFLLLTVLAYLRKQGPSINRCAPRYAAKRRRLLGVNGSTSAKKDPKIRSPRVGPVFSGAVSRGCLGENRQSQQQEERTGSRAEVRWLLASLGCYVLALLSKATGMTLPVLLLVLDVYPLHRFTVDGRIRLRTAVLVEKLPYVALAVAAAAMALVAQLQSAALTLANHSLSARVAQAAYGLCFYLWKTLLPVRLLPMYPLVLPLDPTRPTFVACALAVVGITAALVLLRRRYPWALAAWISYVVLVAPVLGLMQSGRQMAADRYTYVACMPWAVVVAAGIYRLWAIAERRRIAWPAVGVAGAAIVGLLALLGVRTVQQTRIWTNTFTLFDHVLQIEPTPQAYYYRCIERCVRGDLAGALADVDAALRLEPQYIAMHYCRGKVRQAQGDADGAMAEFNAVLRSNPYLGDAYAGRALARQSKGDVAGALADFDHALRLTPEDAESAVNRGNLRQTRGDTAGALADFTHAIAAAVDRGGVEAYYSRANVRAAQGDLAGALADFTEVIRLNPQHADAYNNRGTVRRSAGDLHGALADYTEAVRLAQPEAGNRATFERNLTATRQQLAAQPLGQ